MKYTEFGIENEKTLMIFPGGGVYWNPAAMPFIEAASKHFHLIVVAYDGFNGEEKDAVISDDVLENSTSMRETVRQPISRSISMEKSM